MRQENYLRVTDKRTKQGGMLSPYHFAEAAWLAAPWFRKMIATKHLERGYK